jgi:CheY-like chemotaxis protein
MEIRSKTTTILLLDPNNEDRQYWTHRLKTCSENYHVLEAKDAEMGLAIWKTQRVDCVVTELHLPDMSGFQVLMRLNPIGHRSLRTAVVALSHYVLPSITEAAKKLGAQSYLIKSQASEGDLDRAIQKAIARVGQMRTEVYT